MDVPEIIGYAVTLVSGGAITSLLNIGIARRRVRSEADASEAAAKQANTEVTKSVQDIYQELNEDLRRTISEQKQELDALRCEDRENKRSIRTLHSNQTKMEITIHGLDRKLASLLPFLCSVEGCRKRRPMNCTTLDGIDSITDEDTY